MRVYYQQWVFVICLLHYLCVVSTGALAQNTIGSVGNSNIGLAVNQQKALAMLLKEDTVSVSAFWPNIKPSLFFANLRMNILYPTKINQGAATNFCGYASATHILLKYDPERYLKYLLQLYRHGTVSLSKKTLAPSESIKKYAGTLKQKGELDVLHANQLWFLTLADSFKGYINFFDHQYQFGDENTIWAGTNYSKFNSMLRDFTENDLKCAGSDLVRPLVNDFYEYITKQLQSGIVMLYVNSNFLYPHKFSLFTLRAPTHFIVLYEMYQVGDMIEIKYWDYGLKTEQLITRKRLRKLIFGVTTILPPSNQITHEAPL